MNRVKPVQFFLAVLLLDVVILTALMPAEVLLEWRGDALLHWLENEEGGSLALLFFVKITLLAGLSCRAGCYGFAACWTAIASAKLLGLHLLAAPFLAAHLDVVASLWQLPAIQLGKLAALMAIGVTAGACLLLPRADGRSYNAEIALSGVILCALAVISILPDAMPWMLAKTFEPLAMMIEIGGELVLTTLLLTIGLYLLRRSNQRCEDPAL